MFNHDPQRILHILINMFVLIMFGPQMESIMGGKRFLNFYLFCGVVGGLLTAFIDPSPIPVLGASGAISGLILAFAMYFPRNKLLLFFFIPMEARLMAQLFAAFSLVMIILDATGADLGRMGGISHFGHLAGMIAAVIFFYGLHYLPSGRR